MEPKITQTLSERTPALDLGLNIAAILACEFKSQAAKGVDCNFRVFHEAGDPFGHWDRDDGQFATDADMRPVVNVSLDSGVPDAKNSSSLHIAADELTFHIDCYAPAVAQQKGDGFETGYTRAGKEAIRVYGLARKILNSAQWARLGAQGQIKGRRLGNLQAFQPAVGQRAVMNVRAVRFTLLVGVVENFTQADGQTIERIDVETLDETTGEIIARVTTFPVAD